VNWRNQADCARLTVAEFDRLFFENGNSNMAQAICSACVVTDECRDYATRNLIPFGVWGGESGAARRERLDITKTGEPRVHQLDSQAG
jgi:hypothetical protein